MGGPDLLEVEPLTRAFDRLPAAIIVTTASPEPTLRYANPAADAVFAFGAEFRDCPTEPFWVDVAQRSVLRAELAREGHIRDREALLRRANGEVFWASLSASLASFRGEPAMLVTLHDITPTKRAEARARENEQRYRMLAENTADVIWTMDPSTGQFTYVSPSIERLRGLTVEEALNERLEDALTPASFAKVLGYMNDAALRLSAPGEWLIDVYEQPCRDGSTKQVEIRITLARDAAGELKAIIGVSRDVTERVRAEAAQRRLLEDLRRALSEVKRLSGLVPICAHCKRVRDDAGFWQQVESWVSEHSDARFSHGICPTCTAIHFPDDPER